MRKILPKGNFTQRNSKGGGPSRRKLASVQRTASMRRHGQRKGPFKSPRGGAREKKKTLQKRGGGSPTRKEIDQM